MRLQVSTNESDRLSAPEAISPRERLGRVVLERLDIQSPKNPNAVRGLADAAVGAYLANALRSDEAGYADGISLYLSGGDSSHDAPEAVSRVVHWLLTRTGSEARSAAGVTRALHRRVDEIITREAQLADDPSIRVDQLRGAIAAVVDEGVRAEAELVARGKITAATAKATRPIPSKKAAVKKTPAAKTAKAPPARRVAKAAPAKQVPAKKAVPKKATNTPKPVDVPVAFEARPPITAFEPLPEEYAQLTESEVVDALVLFCLSDPGQRVAVMAHLTSAEPRGIDAVILTKGLSRLAAYFLAYKTALIDELGQHDGFVRSWRVVSMLLGIDSNIESIATVAGTPNRQAVVRDVFTVVARRVLHWGLSPDEDRAQQIFELLQIAKRRSAGLRGGGA